LTKKDTEGDKLTEEVLSPSILNKNEAITKEYLMDWARYVHYLMLKQKDARLNRTGAVADKWENHEFKKGTPANGKTDVVKDETAEEREVLYNVDADLAFAERMYDIYFVSYQMEE
jgi:hypothetical protein